MHEREANVQYVTGGTATSHDAEVERDAIALSKSHMTQLSLERDRPTCINEKAQYDGDY
jgi:hypothetical protein